MTEVIDKEHDWFSPVDDAAEDIAKYWMTTLTEDNDTVFELIEDRAIEVGVSTVDMQNGNGQEWDTHEAFEQACVKRARIKMLKMMAEELEDMP